MMIRAGKREEVLTSDSMWMCTSCYNCIVRCPRELPITHIMHGLAHYAKRLGLAPQNQPTAKFSQKFWDNLLKKGRINELKLGLALYFITSTCVGLIEQRIIKRHVDSLGELKPIAPKPGKSGKGKKPSGSDRKRKAF